MFDKVLTYSFVQRNRNTREITGKTHVYVDIFKFFLSSHTSRRKYIVEVKRYADHLYTVDFYAKVSSVNKYRLKTNQNVGGKLGATVLDIIAKVLIDDKEACFGILAAALLEEESQDSTKRFQLYSRILRRKANLLSSRNVFAVPAISCIFVLPNASALDTNWFEAIINRYEEIFRETS